MKRMLYLVPLLLVGCMSYGSTVIDKEGRTHNCQFSGYGIIGGAIASQNYQECLAKARGETTKPE